VLRELTEIYPGRRVDYLPRVRFQGRRADRAAGAASTLITLLENFSPARARGVRVARHAGPRPRCSSGFALPGRPRPRRRRPRRGRPQGAGRRAAGDHAAGRRAAWCHATAVRGDDKR
jgi:hypothetical protein